MQSKHQVGCFGFFVNWYGTQSHGGVGLRIEEIVCTFSKKPQLAMKWLCQAGTWNSFTVSFALPGQIFSCLVIPVWRGWLYVPFKGTREENHTRFFNRDGKTDKTASFRLRFITTRSSQADENCHQVRIRQEKPKQPSHIKLVLPSMETNTWGQGLLPLLGQWHLNLPCKHFLSRTQTHTRTCQVVTQTKKKKIKQAQANSPPHHEAGHGLRQHQSFLFAVMPGQAQPCAHAEQSSRNKSTH